MDQNQYLEQRLDDQIAWYDRKSSLNQKSYRRLKIFEIIAASAIPLLSGQVGAQVPWHIVVGILGAMIAVCSGVASLFKFHETWIEYRTVAETLRHHRFLFVTRSRPYHESSAFSQLVETVEGILAKENGNWSSLNKTRAEEESSPAPGEATVASAGA